MAEIIRIEMDRAEGAIQRVLGLIERRGFEIDHMDMPRTDTSDAHIATLTLGVRARDAGRCIDVLGRQIDKLHGIRRIMRIAAPTREDMVQVGESAT